MAFSNDAGWASEFGQLRKPRPSDAARIAAFDKEVFGTDSWLRMVWESELSATDRTYLVLETEPEPLRSMGRIIAVGGISHGPEAEVMTVGVHDEYRGRSIASHLLENLLAIPVEHGADAVFLEVRARGIAAQTVYHKLGFEDVGFRPHYYSDDDAIVMKLDLTPGRDARQEDDPIEEVESDADVDPNEEVESDADVESDEEVESDTDVEPNEE